MNKPLVTASFSVLLLTLFALPLQVFAADLSDLDGNYVATCETIRQDKDVNGGKPSITPSTEQMTLKMHATNYILAIGVDGTIRNYFNVDQGAETENQGCPLPIENAHFITEKAESTKTGFLYTSTVRNCIGITTQRDSVSIDRKDDVLTYKFSYKSRPLKISKVCTLK